MPSTWTGERLRLLRVMYEDEKLSCAECAERLGITKGSVAGAVLRNGLIGGAPIPVNFQNANAKRDEKAQLERETFWTSDRIAVLRTMVIEDGNSCASCAQQLGLSKNAVIAACRRYGIPASTKPRVTAREPDELKRQKKARSQRERRRAKSEKEFRPVCVPTPPAELLSLSGERVIFKPLRPFGDGCHYPIGEPGRTGFRLCEAPITTDRRVYCDAHHAICFTRVREPA